MVTEMSRQSEVPYIAASEPYWSDSQTVSRRNLAHQDADTRKTV